jgi:putative FmdB family regulatory protein
VPTYCYYCESCDKHFEAFHSMKSIETICQLCSTEGQLVRVPSMPLYVKKNNAGNIVKQHIEEAKQQLREDKMQATEEYK